MDKIKVWIFRLFALATSAAMVVAFIRVWWTARVGDLITYPQGDYWVHIFAWGIQKYAENTDVTEINSIVTEVTPFYQTVLAWTFLAVCVILVLYSAWLKGWKGSVVQGFIGLAYTAYAWVALHVVVAHKIYGIGVPLTGLVDRGDPQSAIAAEQSVLVHTDIRFGWYLAMAAGIICLALALLRLFWLNNTKAVSQTPENQ